MIHRLVKLTFQPIYVSTFLEGFVHLKPKILAMPGCQHLRLWQSTSSPHVLFTYSIWDGEEQLSEYRQSEFFRNTWAQTKKWFSEPAEAWSLDEPLINF